MGIGLGLFLLSVGAILVFGVQVDAVGWLNLDAIGVILMLAGLISLGMTFYFWRRRRVQRVVQPVVERTVAREAPVEWTSTVREVERPARTVRDR